MNIKSSELLSLEESPLFADFAYDFENCYMRKTKEEVASLRILSENAWPSVWGPDLLVEAHKEWTENCKAGNKQAHKIFEERVMQAQQTREIPRIFLRRLAQLKPELFPVQSMERLTMLREGTYDLPTIHIPGVCDNEDTFYIRSYFKGVDWLSLLPIHRNELVYLARRPDQTLIVEWKDVISYWDAFHCDRFCYLNICDDSNDWFLMMHSERYCVFGCTEEHASKFDISQLRRISEPINYLSELKRLSDDFDRFKQTLV